MLDNLRSGASSRSSYGGEMARYTPAQTAAHSGFSLDTLRYYEKIGLLNDVDRTSGGRRIFSDDDLGWLALLRCLRDTGMPIAQMCRYAELAREGDHTARERMDLLREHAATVEEQMRLLDRQHAHLREKIHYYEVLTGDRG
jgi:DNA-binding transcriptional MerR regulator